MLYGKLKRGLKVSLEYIDKGIFQNKPLLAYVGGWIGKRNLGDEALYHSLKCLFNDFECFHFDAGKNVKLLFKHIPLVYDGVLAGGTLINRIYDWFTVSETFYNINKSMFVFGTGVANPIYWKQQDGWVNHIDKWKILLEKCHYVGVRGPISAEILSDSGVKEVEVIGDPVLVLAENRANTEYEPNTLGLNIAQTNGLQWGEYDEICKEYEKLARMAKDAGWRVEWFVVFPADFEITKKIAGISGTPEHIHQIFEDANAYIDTVKQLSVFVGMRLHATALATCAYVPSVMLEYRPKCLDYMKSIGLEEFNFRTSDFKATTVWEIIKHWNARRDEISNRTFANVTLLREKQLIRAKELKNEIKYNFDNKSSVRRRYR